MTNTIFRLLSDLPVEVDLLLRTTLLLGVAWCAHRFLQHSNSRWRVLVWRFAGCGLILVTATTCLSGIAAPKTKSEPADTTASVPDLPIYRSNVFGAGAPVAPHAAGLFGSKQPQPVQRKLVRLPDDSASAAGLAALPWRSAAFVLWMTVAVALLTRWGIVHKRLRTLIHAAVDAPPHCHDAFQRLSCRCPRLTSVRLAVSSDIDVPMVTGLRHSVILLPQHMTQVDFSAELPSIFCHELAHVRTGDLFWLTLLQWTSVLLWFHPLMWRVTAAHSMACEEVADSEAAQQSGGTVRYSSTLARIALSAAGHTPAVASLSMARQPEVFARIDRLSKRRSESPLAGWQKQLFTATSLLVLAPLLVLQPVAAALTTTAIDEQAANGTPSVRVVAGDVTGPRRQLTFPDDRTVASLQIATESMDSWKKTHSMRFDFRREWNWQSAGRASGTVSIPQDAKVRLLLKAEGVRDLSWVRQLKPDDIHRIEFWPLPSDTAHFGDQQAQDLSHLTGLSGLLLNRSQMTPRGFQHLRSLNSLKSFSFFPVVPLDAAAMQHLGHMKSLEVLHLLKSHWTDPLLQHLGGLNNLQELHLVYSEPTAPGPGLAALLALPQLQHLRVYGACTNQHLACIGKAQQLRALEIASAPSVTDAGMAHVGTMPNLEYLNLHRCSITDAGVSHLKQLTGLKRLDLLVSQYLPNTQTPALTVRTARTLAKFTALEWLALTSVSGVDDFLREISGLSELRTLSIGGFRSTGLISDVGMQHLEQLRKLERVTLGGGSFTDEGLKSLASLSNMRSINIWSNHITNAGLAHLQALTQLENAEISCGRKRGRLTHSGVSQLNGLPALKRLWYNDRRPRHDEPAIDLSHLPRLEDFSMGWVRDQDLAGLAECNLKRLQIGFDSSVTDAGLKSISHMTDMEVLLLSGRGITNEGMASLSGMHNLFSLNLHGNLSDEGLRHLENLTRLESLSIKTQGQVSQQMAQHLRQRMPLLYNLSIDQNRAPQDTPVVRLKPGQPAPQFAATTLNGKLLNLKQYRGRVLLMYFWSTTCGPCVAAVEKHKQSYEALSEYDDFAMISFSGDSNDVLVRNFVQQHELNWPQVRLGPHSRMAASYGVTGYPSYILVGRDGRILCVGAKHLDKTLRKELNVPDES